MGSVLASPRRRRRLAWLAMLVFVALAVALSLVFLRNTAPPSKPKFAKGPPKVYREPPTVSYNGRESASALSVAQEFLSTAVQREHVDRSWAITEPSLRVGYTRRQWSTGDTLPFPPYHFRQVRWKRDYSDRDTIGLEVALFPTKTEHERAMVFFLDLRRHGRGKHERWLVATFVPAPSAGVAPVSGEGGGGGGGVHLAVPEAGGGKSPLGAAWLLLPLSALSLIFLLPLALGIRGYVRNRRAARGYHARPLS